MIDFFIVCLLFYVLIQFKAEGDYVNNELEKRYQFNEDVIRYVIVMLDEKKFKQNPRKEPVRRERPADKAGKAKSENGEEVEDMQEEAVATEEGQE